MEENILEDSSELGQKDIQMQMKAIIRNMKSALITFNVSYTEKGKIIFCNEQYYRLFGYTEEQYKKEVVSTWNLVYVEDRERVRNEIFNFISGDEPIVVKGKFVKRCGDLFCGECRISKMIPKHGQFLYIGVIDDVTEEWEKQDKIEKEYKEQNVQRMTLLRDSMASANLNFTMNSIRDGSAKNELQRKILSESTTVDSFFDNVLAAISIKEEREHFHEIFSREKMIRAYNEGKRHIECEHHLVMEHEDGVWISTLVDLMKNPFNGDIEGNVYSIDISAIKNQEMILSAVTRDTFERLMSIDLKNDLFFMMEKDDVIFKHTNYINRGKYKNFIVEDISRHKFIEPEMEVVKTRFSIDNIRQKLCTSKNYVFITKEENMYNRCMETKKYTFSYIDREKEIVLMSILDITEAVKEKEFQNNKLKEALMAAKEASQAKSEFLTSLSHEIRTPLNAVIGIADVGAEEGGSLKDRVNFKKIASAGDYLLGLINDILEMSQIESGKVALQMETVSATQFLQDTIEIIRPLLLQKNIHLLTDFEGVGDEYIRCDILRTRQIYVNLLNNAIKFSPMDSEIKWTIKRILEKQNILYYVCTITDYGCGMSEEFQKKIFVPFERENNKYTNSMPGTGLGLSICKNVLEQIGGDISVQSKLNVGTTITIHICHEEGKKEEVSDKWIRSKEACDLSGKHILLVEDNEVNAELADTILSRRGANVDHVWNGEFAVDKFKKSKLFFYDFILMDIRMPVMDGITATKVIRELPRKDAKQVPIIAMTADAFTTDVRKTKNAGMNAHLSKPIKPRVLYDILLGFMQETKQKE